ncbi:MAG: 2-oxoacid:acceptor oxidoreductase family protein [Candidatus Eisenbacteria bacterium]|uniref:2-oxoacid:acceptor oxidoreductase family protein n=1 Tax=Eiseniibacteriota bacterium TaxID=2212470 RepID=A0A937XC88_UNCEI|nr:2-oxoacid:acceptor oxidoreductase family protein [Candidatus Eisenbacteria bacterium]
MKVKLEKSKAFYDVYERKPTGDKTVVHYCPGCGHGNIHKMITEAIVDLGVQDRTIFVSPVGCSVFAYYYFDLGNIQAAHGRAPAVGTGVKRVHPDSIVISYQGDGDLAAIGTAEIVHAANRGEKMTVIFVNNAIYGMTGGQMAPTTLEGQRTTTSPYGRSPANEGYPVRVAELINALQAPVYIERTALTDAKSINKTRQAIRKALQYQVENKGFSLVEVLSACPTGWGIHPVQARQWIKENMEPVFPLGCLRDRGAEIPASPLEPRPFVAEGLHELLDHPAPGAEEERAAGAPRPADPFLGSPRVKVAGFGGQGVLLLGLGLASVGMKLGRHVSWLPSYGPEMRGGTANCSVRISDEFIGAPIVNQSDILVAFNRPSLEKFEPDLRPGGMLFYDSSLIDVSPQRSDIVTVAVPATKLADELGNTKAANMVMFGAIVERTGLFAVADVVRNLGSFIKLKKLIPLNEQAVERGGAYIRSLA